MLGLCPQPSMLELCSEPRPSMLEMCSKPRPSMLEQCLEPRSPMLELCSEQRPSMLVQYSKPKANITENQRAQAAKMQSDAEDILKSKHKKAYMTGFATHAPDE